ncbi:MAG: hypothetical protein RLZZ440_1961 [Planctomycetota bacterium]|jgi:hypothetical protein
MPAEATPRDNLMTTRSGSIAASDPEGHGDGDWLQPVLAVVAAFGAYFCMYGLRKPFTAATYADATVLGVGFKQALVISQVLGYTLSKFIGIRVVSEMPPRWRAAALAGLVLVAEAALVGFAVLPQPWNVGCLFINGLPLGMVFGLVLAPLEGRRVTELLTAGLCASFILAGGVMKSTGVWLLDRGISEAWMPATAGAIYLAPLTLFTALLHLVKPPSSRDREARSERRPMNAADRRRFLARYGGVVLAIVTVYVLTNVIRNIRDDFAPEIWQGLGVTAPPEVFTQTEFFVALGVLAASGAAVLVRDNRRGFAFSLGVCLVGFLLLAIALVARATGLVGGFPFMVMTGLGLYLPYVAIHTTVFERLLAMTREPGTIGFLMYLADAFGYLAYVGVMLGGGILASRVDSLTIFVGSSWIAIAISMVALGVTWRWRPAAPPSEPARGLPAEPTR